MFLFLCTVTSASEEALSSIITTDLGNGADAYVRSTLRGDAFAEPTTYNIFGLNDGHAGENWGEMDITWHNAPGNNIGIAGGLLASETTFLGAFDFSLAGASIGDTVSFSSDALVNFLQSDTNDLVTLIVTRDQRNFSVEGFASRENLSLMAPLLEITPVPIPPTALLLVSGLLPLISLVRRNQKY